MHPTQQPADPERSYGRRVRCRFNSVAQPSVESACSLSSSIRALAVKVLSCPCGLIDGTLNFGFGIAGSAADTLLDLPAEIARAAFQPILVLIGPPSISETVVC